MGLERTGWVLARGANLFAGGMSEIYSDRPEYFLDPQRQARRTLGVALAADGATLPWLLDLLRTWQSSGATLPTLLDLVSETPGRGVNTRMLIGRSGLSGGEVARAQLWGYRPLAENAAMRNMARVISELCPEERGLVWTDLGRGLGMEVKAHPYYPLRLPIEAIQYGCDEIFLVEPADFAVKRRAFEQAATPEDVRRALGLGVQRQLQRVVVDDFAADRDKILYFIMGNREAVALMKELLPDGMARFLKIAPFAAVRARNARLFPSGYEGSPDLKEWFPPFGEPDGVARRAGRRTLWLNGMSTPAERAAIVDMALTTATEDRLNSLIFPR